MQQPTHIILVEDDPPLRSSLETLLQVSGFQVTAVGDSLGFYNALAKVPFDVALVDLTLPDQDGETLIAYLRRNTTISIIAITARDTSATRVSCYRSGADLFLGKPINGEELIAAVTSLAARRGVEPMPERAGATRALGTDKWILIRRRRLVSPTEQVIELTVKECELVELLASAADVMPRNELLEKIYHRQDESADRALETLVRRTRRKIAEIDGDAPLLTVYGIGYTFSVPIELH